MSHRSKRETVKRRCRVCGNTWHDFKGEKTNCPYSWLHKRAQGWKAGK